MSIATLKSVKEKKLCRDKKTENKVCLGIKLFNQLMLVNEENQLGVFAS